MTVAERLHALVDPLPPGSMIMLQVDVVRAWLDARSETTTLSDGTLVDLTVEEAAKLLKRAPSTVRGWCKDMKLEGAYRLNEREWRIPRAALRAYQESQAQARRRARLRLVRDDLENPDLSGWREERRRAS